MTFSHRHLSFILIMLACAGLIGLFIFLGVSHDKKMARERTAAVLSGEIKLGLSPQALPTSFVFVEDRGNHYFIYKDEYGFYLVYKDDLFAASVHIVYLGKGK